MFETDYPHPTCQAPGPASAGTHPYLYAEKALAGIPEPTRARVLQTTAQRIYGLQ
jgi:predicted TIM-barrel fold metal-dependent hydrolase